MKTLPEKEDILRLLADAPAPMTKREIVRAFGITGDLRRPMKALLREMEANGHIVKQPGQIYSVPEALPAVTVVQVSEIDIDGDVFARPADWDEEVQGEAPRIEILPDQRGHPAVKEGDRILVRLRKYTDRFYEGNIIRRLDDPRGQVIGMKRIEQESDRTELHAVDRLAEAQVAMQGTQHEAVATEGHDDVGLFRRDVAIAFLELGQLGLGLRAMARHQCDALSHLVTPRGWRCAPQQAPTLTDGRNPMDPARTA